MVDSGSWRTGRGHPDAGGRSNSRFRRAPHGQLLHSGTWDESQYARALESKPGNRLFTYRINAGTVFYIGYDDHYRQADRLFADRDGDGFDEQLFFTDDLRRTNRALFTKVRYLFRF